MSELIQAGFDYAALPVDLSVSLRLHADRYVAVRNRAAYEMGKEIYEAQQELASHDKTQGQFGAWVESLGITRQTGYDLITLFQGVGSDVVKLFDNKKLSQTVSVMLLRSPESVIDQAVAKAESGDKVTVADVKDWKLIEAQLEAERQARLTAEQRAQEFGVESNERRKKIRELEEQIDLLGNQAKPEPVIVEKAVIPNDYESAKEQAVKLKDEIKKLREKQDALVQQQVKEKMKEREKELDDLNSQASEAETRLSSLRKHIDSYSSIERMTRLQREQIEKVRSVIAELAANMEGFTRLENDKDTDRLWSALADMLRNGAAAIDFFTGVNNSGLSLTA